MKKKKQTSDALIIAADDTTASAVAGNSSDVVGDIKTLVKDHASFFDKLVELIPAKFYLPTNDDEKPWFQGLSKAAKAEAKLKSIENTKKSRQVKEKKENERDIEKEVSEAAKGIEFGKVKLAASSDDARLIIQSSKVVTSLLFYCSCAKLIVLDDYGPAYILL
uniref:Ribosomal RNA-processing protein 14 N-terminal domain-containing protein n=1 Tax=Chenopodium quinoa TaxID=63459 RepID=A0A803N2P2_CHEQI